MMATDDQGSRNFRIWMEQSCLMGSVQGALSLRGTLTDVAVLDAIERAVGETQARLDGIRGVDTSPTGVAA